MCICKVSEELIYQINHLWQIWTTAIIFWGLRYCLSQVWVSIDGFCAILAITWQQLAIILHWLGLFWWEITENQPWVCLAQRRIWSKILGHCTRYSFFTQPLTASLFTALVSKERPTHLTSSCYKSPRQGLGGWSSWVKCSSLEWSNSLEQVTLY